MRSPWRWPVIRHVRCAGLVLRYEFWWRALGRHLGLVPNPVDVEFLRRVWRGEE